MSFEKRRQALMPTPAEQKAALAEFDATGKDLTREVDRSLFGRDGLTYHEKVQALKLNVVDIEGLAPDVQESIVDFYGRSITSMQELNWQNINGFVNAFIIEYLRMASVPDQPAQYYELLKRIRQYVGYKRAVTNDTNVSGDPIFDAVPELERFAMELQAVDKYELQERFVNPYGLKAGDELYRLTRDGQALERVAIEKITDSALDPGIKEPGSIVILNGEKAPLYKVNRLLGVGRFMLRDGSNYFGSFEQPPQVEFKMGEKVKFRYEHPLKEDDLETEIEWRGTNEKDLNERYGEAWRPYWRSLLMIWTQDNVFPLAKCKFEGR